MPDNAGIVREYAQNFLLDESKLRKISEVVRTHVSKLGEAVVVRYTVVRQDSSFYETQNIDEVLKDDNASPKEIKRLMIEIAKPKRVNTVAGVEMGAKEEEIIFYVGFLKDKDEKIKFRVEEKNRDWCFLFADELETQIKRILKPSLPGYFRGPFVELFVFTFVLACLYAGYMFYNHLFSVPLTNQQILAMSLDQKVDYIAQTVNKRASADFGGISMLAIFPLIFVLVELRPISKTIDYFFGSVFYWGDAALMHDKSQKLLRGVFWGVVGTGILGLLVNYISLKIF